MLSMMPFLVPGSQSSLQLENGTLRTTDANLRYSNDTVFGVAGTFLMSGTEILYIRTNRKLP